MEQGIPAPCRGALRRARLAVVTVGLALGLIASGLAGVALSAAAEPQPAPLAQVGRTPLPVATPAAPTQLTPVRATPTPTAVAPVSIPAADQQLRQAVAAALTEAARRANVSVDTREFVYGSRDDVTVVNAAVAGADRVTIEDLERGSPLLFVYLRGVGAERPLPDGFYTVTVRGTPESATAQLRNEAGAIVAEVPARITRTDAEQPAERPIKLSIHIDENGVSIDIKIGPITIVIGTL
jgi:hypothetical protein